MKGTIGRLVWAVVLIGLGFTAWSEAQVARVMAADYERLATFRFEAHSSVEPPVLRWVATRLGRDEGEEIRQAAAAEYWVGRYDLLTGSGKTESEGTTVDPDVLFVTANAAFRAMGPIAAPNLTHLPRLDNVLAAYAAVLKADPGHGDAAWNYEFVARLREVASRTPPPAPPKGDAHAGHQGAKPALPPPPEAAPRMTLGDLPAGPTIHGRPGGPPPATRGEEFQVITPMEYGERESQPEASPGGKLPRKG